MFARYPEVKNSSVELESTAGGFVLVNSEGTEVREPESVSLVRIRAMAQAADGMTLRDAITFHCDGADVPARRGRNGRAP